MVGANVALVVEDHLARGRAVGMILDSAVAKLMPGRADVIGVAQLAGGVQPVGIDRAGIDGLAPQRLAGMGLRRAPVLTVIEDDRLADAACTIVNDRVVRDFLAARAGVERLPLRGDRLRLCNRRGCLRLCNMCLPIDCKRACRFRWDGAGSA